MQGSEGRSGGVPRRASVMAEVRRRHAQFVLEVHRGGTADRRRRAARAGMTIIELTLTIVILVIVWGGALSSQLAASDLVQTGRETAIASADLQSCMERVLVMPITEIPIAGSAFESGQPIALYEELHLDSERVVATYPGYAPGGAVPDPLTIVLTITWRDFDGRQRTMDLATQKTR